jgi:poly-gamma-glutamate synthase PgsB/CapB
MWIVLALILLLMIYGFWEHRNHQRNLDSIPVRIHVRVEVVVLEWMGIQPQLQYVSEHQMVRSTVGVITNVRPDHLDEMGPTLEEVGDSLCNTIPRGEVFFTSEKERLQTIQRWAEGIGIRFHPVSPSNISSAELSGFSYLEHRENVALALSVCEHLGVVRKTAPVCLLPL